MSGSGIPSRLRRRRISPRWGDSLAPLLDVIFLLVIFLLVSARFDRTRSIEVDLPSARGEAALHNDAVEPLILVLLADGQLRWRGETVAPGQLTARLDQLPPEDRLRPFTVQADRTVPLEAGIQVLELLRILGWSQVEFEVSGTPEGAGILENPPSEP